MLKLIERQINSVKRGVSKILIHKAKNFLAVLKAIYVQRCDPLWLWLSVPYLTDYFGLKSSFPYFRAAKTIYSRSFLKFVKNGDLKAVDLTADHIASLICKGLTYEPDNFVMFEFLAGIKLFIGQVDEWAKYTEIAFEKREQLRNQVLPRELGIRLFSTSSVASIGFDCHWEGLLHAQCLGLIPPDNLVMIWNGESPSANHHWMSYLRQYVILLDEKKNEYKNLIGYLKGIEREASEYIANPFRIGNHVYVYNHSALALIEKHWDRENRNPLFTLTPEDIDYGRDKLSSLGVPKDAWFVCLHVREGGFKANEFFRQAPIQDYIMAIKAVVDRGGWVIRMGDQTMSPLQKMDNVIDYPHSVIYSDRMDIILCGLCRFFVTTATGLYTIAQSFGKPIILTNFLPTANSYLSKQDVFLPKLAKRVEDGNMLRFSEIMSVPFSFGVHDINYKQLGVELINNTPEEIMEIVEEMINKLDGIFKVDATDEDLQTKFKDMTAKVGTLYGLDNVPINCQIGTHFLRRHQYLLPSI